MTRDEGVGGVGRRNGLLTQAEVKSHLDDLTAERKKSVAAGHSTTYVDMKLNSGRQLYKDMVECDAIEVQYLPEALMELPQNLRRRACELLEGDDISMLGEIDQFVIDHARGRYNAMTPMTAVMIKAKKDALAELDKIADALDLE